MSDNTGFFILFGVLLFILYKASLPPVIEVHDCTTQPPTGESE